MPIHHAFVIQEHPPLLAIDDGGQTCEISPLWLRERTQAPDQLESMTQQRLFDSHAIDAALKLESVKWVDSYHVDLAFSDGHRETYDLHTLDAELDDVSIFPAAEPWDASLSQAHIRFDWHRVLEESAYFRASLDAYIRYG
ncbi:gamma-butyrobetaine hydroxylase-like domain-containing protein [Chromohalobacter canadensis]|uniref:Gamma-butyrobetaine hydroxylase-like domain-containing protein n=1 Tax=Chromohalobacter canadensis TaxID=141389 RepID=A0ABZ0Y8S8_9GAMM|nr:gamma-butyrobetaine hydroxylase-like domain-containing protein [Chromohalobacter canadensis]MCK0768523.1 DUF971 domain-containing protein [Chromohalobacter canadensis]WQH08301.1 gamma-butyrobetaine hydroxylase-like domain-containing protein [Chromohalobacter canadensis]